MTLLIANTAAPERDVVDAEWEDFPAALVDLEVLLTDLSSSVAIELRTLDPASRFSVGQVFDRYRHLASDEIFGPLFLGFFLARAEADVQMLSEKLNWISHLEDLLRDFQQEGAQARLGERWHRATRDAAEAVGIGKKEPADFTLRETVDVLSKMIASSEVDGVLTTNVLGSDWQERLRGLTEPFHSNLSIRNDISHGRVYKNRQAYWEHWPDVADRVFRAADIYVRLRRRDERR